MYGPNEFSNPNLGDDEDYTENDGNIANGRFEFNALDGGNIGSQYLSLRPYAWYRLDWMQDVTEGDFVVAMTPNESDPFIESGPCMVYFQAPAEGGVGITWRQYGNHGPGWIDAFLCREVNPQILGEPIDP